MAIDRLAGRPKLSVVVPTYGRPDKLEALLATIERQTLDRERFEVIVVDDGTPQPIALDLARYSFALELLRQPNAGPGAARNLGAERARGEFVMFLNDDAVLAQDLFEVHLKAHREARSSKVAVLGTFTFTRESLEEPFTQLCAESSLLFDFVKLRDRELHPWQFFWTCNLSLSKAEFDAVGGFDPRFREAIVEDVELGYRLQKNGVQVLFRADAKSEHAHALTVDGYFKRALRLGVNLARMAYKHDDPTILWLPAGSKVNRSYLLSAQMTVEAYHESAEKFVEATRRWADSKRGQAVTAAEREKLVALTRKLSHVSYLRGVLLEITGTDPGAALAGVRPPRELVSIIACSYNALEKTKNCVESLRRTLPADQPVEILFVDNGSSDGSAEWLAAQSDVRLLANAENVGAPKARNQALARARGKHVVFLDNDIVLTPAWLERMLYFVELDGRTGCVGACADRASHGQEVAYSGPTDFDSVAAFARSHGAMNARKTKVMATLASFCILVRREVLDTIGGFDERFSPWGFEDDDYTLRAFAAGFTNRIALDVFVRHDTYSGAKLQRHVALLERNWKHFAAKWGLDPGRYGDLSGLQDLDHRTYTRDQLFCAFAEGPVGALPVQKTVSQPAVETVRT
ncbi:MAG: glycosyltransferase family 2 protein [Planctomycetes bacterium]|nr:glycosyltransferase family 2 protein [Planctomycetota bacterium]